MGSVQETRGDLNQIQLMVRNPERASNNFQQFGRVKDRTVQQSIALALKARVGRTLARMGLHPFFISGRWLDHQNVREVR